MSTAFLQTINGKVIDLNKKAGSADYVEGGCGAACKNNHCKLGGKCLDNYNVYECDCSMTPFNGYFCQKGMLLLFFRDSALICRLWHQCFCCYVLLEGSTLLRVELQ